MVLAIHQSQIEQFGGSPGMRDQGAFESAVAQAEASFGGEFLHADLFEMAAAYMFHLTQNHAFIDGNKREGLASASVFLALNGYRLVCDERLYDLSLQVAQGQVEKPAIAQVFRELTALSRR